MNSKFKNNLLFILFTLIIGLVAGGLVWAFLSIMNLGIKLLWEYIPSKFEIPFYTLLICTVGGLLIGLWHVDYPEDLNTVMSKVKKTKRYNYDNLLVIFLSALFPIILGASVGPEAGLASIIAGICTWISDKFKFLNKEKGELSNIGIAACLGTIFSAPLFAVAMPIENENEKIPPKIKLVSYFFAILGALLSFKLLSLIYKGGLGLPSFYDVTMTSHEYIGLIFLIFIGIILGYIFILSEKFAEKIMDLIKSPIIKGLTAGIILGICGTILPYTMFSGEEQSLELKNNFASIGATTLIATAIIKLILTNICIQGGLKGGHFFPIIFASISFGYGISLLSGLDAIFCVIIITTSLLSFTLRKPLAVILLLIMIFPPVCIIPIIISAIVPLLFPTSKKKDA